MTLSIRAGACVLAFSTMLAACSEDGAPIITGENSVVASTSAPVFDADGNDLTAVNQTNFPLPLPVFTGGATPNTPSTPSAGGDVEEEINPNSGDANPNSGASSDIYFPSSEPELKVDPLGGMMALLVDVIGRGVGSEFQRVTNGSAYSDGTAEIVKRLNRDWSACENDGLSSSLEANGSSITGGVVTYSNCVSEFGAILDGRVEIQQATASEGEAFSVNISVNVEVLEGNIARLEADELVLTGELLLVSVGDQFTVTSDLISVLGYGANRRFVETNVTSQITTGGDRNLNGTTTMDNLSVSDSIEFTFDNVEADLNAGVPWWGSITMVHSTNDTLVLRFNGSGNDTISEITRPDGTFVEDRFGPSGNRNTYVPF